MEFRVLGAVAVTTREGGPIALGPAKRRSVLAMLLLRPGTAVAVDRLTRALWDGQPPRHARTVLQGHISALRALLTAHDASAHGVALITQGQAYVLRVPGPLLDSHRFDELCRLARTRREPAQAVQLFREALALWRGPALGGTVCSPVMDAAAHALDDLRLAAVKELAALHGQLGDHEAAVAVLRGEAAAHPLREHLIAALMGALCRTGRPKEALDWFHRTRGLLVERSGARPGQVLTEAHTAALQESGRTARRKDRMTALRHSCGTGTGPVPVTRTRVACPPEPVAVPELLPPRPRGFVGRENELMALDAATAGSPAPLVMINGGAGTGKTALAVHWSQLRRARFPDGQLFVDLCGYSAGPARDTTSVLRELLLALGVPAEAIPVTSGGIGARYRALTAGRRMLVVLDNARSSRQVRPLLPGGEHCVTLVTSRERLGGLVASDAARSLPLTTLSAGQSLALLTVVLGEELVEAEREAATRLVELCGGLPLALRVAAARVATRPTDGLAGLCAELACEHRRLDLLDFQDTGVARALGLTARHLPGPALHMLRVLGSHTGPTLGVRTAAALAGCSPRRAAETLDQLAAAHLIDHTGRDTYAVHHLVRLFARTLTPESASGNTPEGRLPKHDHQPRPSSQSAPSPSPASSRSAPRPV
ncbi:AfsR/SARP family transcriptional regulator [Streptomyces sp. NPDC018352]|uniref:AfsR/SARP family transcriptional regulator n=1 Tax=Streptomyces sp. NPDC018352 TaxID=3157194 RepID=UPI0034015DFF